MLPAFLYHSHLGHLDESSRQGLPSRLLQVLQELCEPEENVLGQEPPPQYDLLVWAAEQVLGDQDRNNDPAPHVQEHLDGANQP